MSNTYTLTGEAQNDLSVINRDLVALSNPQTANRFLQTFDRKCQLLAQFPEMGVQWQQLIPPLRIFPLNQYLIFYRPIKEDVEVVRVLSGYLDLTAIFPELGESIDTTEADR
jgi:toxin ParE1/3/4